MAEQLACRQKAVKKLSTLSQHNLLYTPLALEQSSGECTAAYKALFMSGKSALDLSGGLGVDTMFLAVKHLSGLYISQKLEKSNRNHSSLNFHQPMKSWRIYFRPGIF